MDAAADNLFSVTASCDQCTCQSFGTDEFVRLSTDSFEGYEEVREGYDDFEVTVAINSYLKCPPHFRQNLSFAK